MRAWVLLWCDAPRSHDFPMGPVRSFKQSRFSTRGSSWFTAYPMGQVHEHKTRAAPHCVGTTAFGSYLPELTPTAG